MLNPYTLIAIALGTVKEAVAAAIAKARENNWTMAVSTVDMG